MSLERQVKLAMDVAIQEQKDQEEEQRIREGLARYGYEDADLDGVNLAGLRTLLYEVSGGGREHFAKASDHLPFRRQMALDAKGNDLSVRYGVSRPRRL